MTNEFLQFTKSKGNNLVTPSSSFPGLKEGDKWCLCALRWEEANKANKAPPVDLEATDRSALKFNTLNSYTRKANRGGKRKTRKQKFDVYIDADPSDTIPIRYTTVEDVKNTIKKLEKLYKTKRYPHKRIWQVGMILKVRLEVLKKTKPEQYKLAEKYFKFLGKRTKLNEEERYKLTLTLNH
jgi:hypothetical protein